jgi:branched-chain amino acid transport system ATP-binding protein
LFGEMSVRENLDLGGQHLTDEATGKAARLAVRTVPDPEGASGPDGADAVSGGEQQMLAIGRALMMQPKILILDEPTLGLAPVILELLSKALEKLRQTTPITVLLGEQNVTFALPHADRVYVLEHARIVWEGDPGRFAAEAGEGFLSLSARTSFCRSCLICPTNHAWLPPLWDRTPAWFSARRAR